MAKDLLTTYKYGWKTSYYQNTYDNKKDGDEVDSTPSVDNLIDQLSPKRKMTASPVRSEVEGMTVFNKTKVDTKTNLCSLVNLLVFKGMTNTNILYLTN